MKYVIRIDTKGMITRTPSNPISTTASDEDVVINIHVKTGDTVATVFVPEDLKNESQEVIIQG